MTETSKATVTIRREGRLVTLINDGKEISRRLPSEEQAIAVYQHFKKEIEEAEVQST